MQAKNRFDCAHGISFSPMDSIREVNTSSAFQQQGIGRVSFFPAFTLQFRRAGVFLSVAHAKVRDQQPLGRHGENCRDAHGIEYGDPPDPDAISPRRQPQGVDRPNDRVFQRFRHGAPAESGALRGCPVGEYRELHGCAMQTGQL